MASRPTVQVYGGAKPSSLPMPAVLVTPIRTDVVQDVHTKMAKNRRQAYAVAPMAGKITTAKSWGTGRAIARIPRVGGSGTHRSGQAAYGNMCRGGRMFAPTKTWRKWHVKIAQGQRRYAVCSALAATAVPALVQARGHRLSQVPEVPLVVADEAITDISKTKQAVDLLKSIGAYEDVERAKYSRKLRSGKGKMRDRRFVSRRGPLVVYAEKSPLVAAFRNLPGVELCAVSRLNLLQLAPGGHVGRFVIWTASAFKQLDAVFGTWNKRSQQKSNFTLPRPLMVNADLARIINSDEIQSKVRPTIRQKKYHQLKKNPLTNLGVRVKLDPFYATSVRRNYQAKLRKAKVNKDKVKASRKKAAAKHKDSRKAFAKALLE